MDETKKKSTFYGIALMFFILQSNSDSVCGIIYWSKCFSTNLNGLIKALVELEENRKHIVREYIDRSYR